MQKKLFDTNLLHKAIFLWHTIHLLHLKYNLNLRVVGVARNHEKAIEVFGEMLEFPNISFVYQDIIEPIEFDGVVDYIFHTAGPAAPLDFKTSAVNTFWAHVCGTHNVCEFAINHKTKKIFYVSTVEIYGNWESDKGERSHIPGFPLVLPFLLLEIQSRQTSKSTTRRTFSKAMKMWIPNDTSNQDHTQGQRYWKGGRGGHTISPESNCS